MNKTMDLFKIFHQIKKFTTISYSMKKLQDLVENKLSREVSEEEVEEINNQVEVLVQEIQVSLDELSELILNKKS